MVSRDPPPDETLLPPLVSPSGTTSSGRGGIFSFLLGRGRGTGSLPYFKFLDDEEAWQFQRSVSCLLALWAINVACNISNLALALTILLHPQCMAGSFSWTAVHTIINLLVLVISIALGIVGLRMGSPTRLFQACAGHILLFAYETLLFARDACIISFSAEEGQLKTYFRGGMFHRNLFVGVCATAGFSAVISLANAPDAPVLCESSSVVSLRTNLLSCPLVPRQGTCFRSPLAAPLPSKSDEDAAAACQVMRPAIAFDASAAAAGDSSLRLRAPAGTPGALFFPGFGFIALADPSVAFLESYHKRVGMSGVLQTSRPFFTTGPVDLNKGLAALSTKAIFASPNVASPRAPRPAQRFDSWTRSPPPQSHLVPPASMSPPGTAAFAASKTSRSRPVCSKAVFSCRRLILRSLPACLGWFFPAFASPSPRSLSGPTCCRYPLLDVIAPVHTASLPAGLLESSHSPRSRSSSRPFSMPPSPSPFLAGPSSLAQLSSIVVGACLRSLLSHLPAAGVLARSFSCGLSSPVPQSRAESAATAGAVFAFPVRDRTPVLQVLYSLASALASGFPALLFAAAQHHRHTHTPPLPHGGSRKHHNYAAGGDIGNGVLGTEADDDSGAPAGDAENPTVMRTPPTIRPRRRVPGRRSSSDWQQLFGDLRLVDMALPATLHSALTDVNSVKYFELAVAQKVPVSRQLLDGIRMFDVRAWKDEQDKQWYSEVPWRLEDDFRLLREHAPAADEAATSSFVSSMLRSLPLPLRPGGKDRGRKGQQGSGKRGGGGARKVPNKVMSSVDLHSWTSLEEGLFRPIQDFLRTHISEVVVVVISSFNGNRKTAMNAVPHAASLSASLHRLATRLQQRQQDGTVAGSSSTRLEGHPFYDVVFLRGPANPPGSEAGNERAAKQQLGRNAGGASSTASGAGAEGAVGGGAMGTPGSGGASNSYAGLGGTPVLSPGSLYTSAAYLDSLAASPPAYEVLDPLDTTCSFYMSSAVRKPLTYADVASFMALVDTYWGQLLPRHSHVFFGQADESAYSPPATVQAAHAADSTAAAGAGSAGAGVAGTATAPPAAPATDPPNTPAGPAQPAAESLPESASSSPPRVLNAEYKHAAAEIAAAATAAGKKRMHPQTRVAASLPDAGLSGAVGGARGRPAGAVPRPDAGSMREMAGRRAAKLTAAAVHTSRTRSGGAPQRAVASTDARAAAVRRTALASAAAAVIPTGSLLDARVSTTPSGATAAVFNGGLDGLAYPGAKERTPTLGRAGTSDAASALMDNDSEAPSSARGIGAEYNSFGVTAPSMSNQIDSYPMYESLHRPEAFAEWLRAQGDLLLATATLKDLLDAKIRMLLFVDDPLIAWYLTAFSREHVIVFVAADHIYDVLYKSMLLDVSREATWAGCRERCESTPFPPPRSDEGRLVAKLRAVRGRMGQPPRDTGGRSCSYWTFEPPLSLGNLPSVLNNNEEVYPLVPPSDLGLLPFTPLSGSNRGAGKTSKAGGVQQQDGSSPGAAAGAGLAGPTPLELKGECRIYTGPLTLADTVPLHGSIIQPRSCGLRTLYELPTQWASAAVFADLTDAVCPIFEVAPSRRPVPEDVIADANGRSAASALGDALPGSGKEERQHREARAYQFFPELCMLDATPRSLRDAFGVQDEDGNGHGGDGTRGGRREVGPVDAVALMNELAATWALWQLERQQLVASLTVLDTGDQRNYREDGYPEDQAAAGTVGGAGRRGSAGDGPDGTNSAFWGGTGGTHGNNGYADSDSHMYVGKERPRSTRPVNALMVMRYDQTKSLIKNFSHLNYFEVIMNLNPQPKETRAIFFQSGEGAELSSDRYVKVTAILNSVGVDEESGDGGELDSEGFEPDDITDEEKRDQTIMMWLAICASVICFLIVAIGSTLRSAFFTKRNQRGGWTAAETPRRASVASENPAHSRRLETLS